MRVRRSLWFPLLHGLDLKVRLTWLIQVWCMPFISDKDDNVFDSDSNSSSGELGYDRCLCTPERRL